jgi:hypothetical protein
MTAPAPWALAAERPQDLEAAIAGGWLRPDAGGWAATLADGAPVRFGRLYAGEEFCAQLILTPAELQAFAALAADVGAPVTLLTPPVTDDELAALRPLLAILQGLPDPELVANDWGTLRLAAREVPGVRRVLGRVLRRQLKDPRADARKATAHLPAAYVALLERLGVAMISADRLPDGPSALPLALHVPFEFVTSGRICAVSGVPYPEPSRKFLVDFHCPRPCRDFSLRLADPSCKDVLWQKGNTLHGPNGGAGLVAEAEGRVDRWVYDLSIDRERTLLRAGAPEAVPA